MELQQVSGLHCMVPERGKARRSQIKGRDSKCDRGEGDEGLKVSVAVDSKGKKQAPHENWRHGRSLVEGAHRAVMGH